jgi:hypothetical protein
VANGFTLNHHKEPTTITAKDWREIYIKIVHKVGRSISLSTWGQTVCSPWTEHGSAKKSLEEWCGSPRKSARGHRSQERYDKVGEEGFGGGVGKRGLVCGHNMDARWPACVCGHGERVRAQ